MMDDEWIRLDTERLGLEKEDIQRITEYLTNDRPIKDDFEKDNDGNILVDLYLFDAIHWGQFGRKFFGIDLIEWIKAFRG